MSSSSYTSQLPQRRADGEDDSESGPGPIDPSSKDHGGPPNLLIATAACGDLDFALVRQGNRPYESQRGAVPRCEISDRHPVPGLDGILSAFAEPEIREDVGGARCH